jgi:predicted GIY-YIG superfamily endonuclease
MDELESIKKRRLTEHQQGDVRKACENAGVSSTIFQSAMRKKKINDLTDKEIKAIMAFKNILDERLEKKEKLRKML